MLLSLVGGSRVTIAIPLGTGCYSGYNYLAETKVQDKLDPPNKVQLAMWEGN